MDKLQPLLDWKQSLDQELETLQVKRAELNEAIARKEAQARNLRELLESEGHLVEKNAGNRNSPTDSITDAAYAVVKKIGQPLYYKDLADRLVDAGTSIPGRDPNANLLSYMARDQRFQRVGRGTYALVEWGLRPKRKAKASRTQKATTRRARSDR